MSATNDTGNVVHFNSKLIGNSAQEMVNYLKAVGAPIALQKILLGASKDHFTLFNANGKLSFNLNARVTRGIFEMRLSTDDPENEGSVIPLVFVSSSMMHMGHYAAVSGLTPVEIPDWDSTSKFFSGELHGITDAVGSVTDTPGLNEAFAFGLNILGDLVRYTSQVYVTVEESKDNTGSRHYMSMVPIEDEDECEFISVTFTEMGIKLNKEHNLKAAKAVMPSFAPMWTNDEDGTIKATLTMHKESSPLFKGQKPHVWEEIIGTDRKAMEAHIRKSMKWLAHYGIYYNTEGWEYNVKWGTHKPKKKKE